MSGIRSNEVKTRISTGDIFVCGWSDQAHIPLHNDLENIWASLAERSGNWSDSGLIRDFFRWARSDYPSAYLIRLLWPGIF